MVDSCQTNFIVAPVTTPLQRLTVANAATWVLVNMPDDEYVDFQALRSALAELPDRHLRNVFFSVRHVVGRGQTLEWVDGDLTPQPVLFKQNELVRLAFEGLGKEMGFRGTTVEAYLDSQPRDWGLVVADFVDHAERDATAEESPSGDHLVEIYPVRTTMSRFQNPDAEYVIRIVPIVNDIDSAIAQRIPASIEAYWSPIEAQRRSKVAYLITTTVEGRKPDEGLHLLVDHQFWNQRLGFELTGYRHLEPRVAVPS